jgi:FKBP-type peptidyl-prolyl cis-trans isomerase
MPCNRLHKFLFFVLPLCCSCSQTEPRAAVKQASSSIEKLALIEINRQLIEKDREIIETVIYQKGWEMNYHTEGYYSVLMEEGQGKKIGNNSSVKLLCKVQLLDGTVCYDKQIRSFKVNTTNEIAGLHQGLINRYEGDKLRFIFPPHMAYGLLGDRDEIPPRATLIFDVEILNVNGINEVEK